MITLSIRDNFPAVQQSLQRLQSDIRDKAIAAALNKTADKAKAEMKRAIVEEFVMRSSDVAAQLSVRRASAKAAGVLVAELSVASSFGHGRGLNLIRFLENERAITYAEIRRRVKGGTIDQLHFRIRRHGGLKTIAGAFVVRPHGGGAPFVARRVGKARYPIKAVTTIDVAQMFNARRINDRVIAKIVQAFPVEFDRAAKLFVDRFNAR
jgi:hypothetical protein